MQRPIAKFETLFGTEEYIVHSILPKIQIFQLTGPRNERTWQESHKLFKQKIGFWGMVKLSLHISYLKMWDFK
jgi:hypothetical protein